MHVLTVLDHPDQTSLSHAVAKRFMEGVQDAGHSAELADLHAEGFDPRWSLADLAQFEDRPMPPDVLAEQARIERCDAFCLVFPLFWYGMPAMMKGWLDRVWSWGWAYNQVMVYDASASLQKPRTGVMLIPAGANPENWEPYGIDTAMNTIWNTGTMGFLGVTDKRIHFLNGSTGSRERRVGLLEKAYQVGRQIDQKGQ
ncbi:MAG: NAD(P)H-dependent oxidoreductase [Pseudomonadota bacterium]